MGRSFKAPPARDAEQWGKVQALYNAGFRFFSYRNCVAASREANNKKGAMSAEDFLRRLFREGYLSEPEFQDRLHALARLKAGELRPLLAEG